MSRRESYELCPICASPNTFVIAEKNNGHERRVKRECVCGETWWNREPATDPPADSSAMGTRFTLEDWKRKVLKDMSELDQNPEKASALSKRGF